MDARRLLTFRTVAVERSFSRAAERLSLTQPSVSQQIALLETELGVRLIDRARGGLRLTHAGQVLLEHAEYIHSRLQLADTQLATLAADYRGQLRLGVFPTAATGFVPAAIARLRRTHSELRVQLSEGTSRALESRLLNGELDCALGYQDAARPRNTPQGTKRVDLLQETFMIGLPREHPLASETGPVSLTAFADDDWIMPSTEGFLIQACRDAGFDPRIVSVTSGPLTTRGLIMRGLGVGWVASLLVSDSTGIVVRPIQEEIRRRDIYILLPPGDRHPFAQHIVDALVATAGNLKT